MSPPRKLSHFDDAGKARMVDVGEKAESLREAVAAGAVVMQPETLALIKAGQVGKGDVLGTARVAAIQGLKRTAELIPLCHPVRVVGSDVDFELDEAASAVRIRATVRALDRTGVEMEAMTAVAVAGLTIYDMVKSADRAVCITDVQLLTKSGGKSGTYQRGK